MWWTTPNLGFQFSWRFFLSYFLRMAQCANRHVICRWKAEPTSLMSGFIPSRSHQIQSILCLTGSTGVFWKKNIAHLKSPRIKAGWLHPRYYQHRPLITDTDQVHGLVMVLLRVIAIFCAWQAEPLISIATRQTFELNLWPWPEPWPTFDIDLKVR